jgi:Ca-activated chloride channel homolog
MNLYKNKVFGIPTIMLNAVVGILFFTAELKAQSAHQLLQKADKAYDNNDFASAEDQYKQAEAKKNSQGKGAFNLGNTFFQQKKYDEAQIQYQEAAKDFWRKEDKAEALYNLGNVYLEKKDYDKSIETYKNSLRLNPNDVQAKKNLTLALQQKKQQEQKQQQNKDNKNQNQENQNQEKDPNQNQQNQEKNQQNQSEKQEKSQKQGQQGQQNSQQNQTQQQALPKEKQAQEQLLKVIGEADKKTLRKVQQNGKPKQHKGGKDW